MGHIPVLFDECIDRLNIKPNGIYLDLTLGGFGHGRGICEKLSEDGTYIATDLDLDAIKRGEDKSKDLICQTHFFHTHFNQFEECLDSLGIDEIDGCLIDLGVSSFQIDETERGFSFLRDARLDMRMNSEATISAYDIVNTYSEDELRTIFYSYGEEKFSSKIAKKIVEYRTDKPIETTFELVEIIKSGIPKKFHFEGKHPATRCFQAIRIEVNQELSGLGDCIDALIDRLSKKGRLAIISFHSLEDRIVKTTFAKRSQGCTCPKDFPICVCKNTPDIKLINRSPIVAKEKELDDNVRARSAKLRVAEKVK